MGYSDVPAIDGDQTQCRWRSSTSRSCLRTSVGRKHLYDWWQAGAADPLTSRFYDNGAHKMGFASFKDINLQPPTENMPCWFVPSAAVQCGPVSSEPWAAKLGRRLRDQRQFRIAVGEHIKWGSKIL